MFEFRLTTEPDVIKGVFTSPNNLWFNFDDDHPSEDFDPANNGGAIYIEIIKGEDTFGIITLKEQEGFHEVHLSFLPRAYGKVGIALKECLEWIRARLKNVLVLVAPVIAGNTLVTRKIESIGFRPFLDVVNYWVKDGVAHTATLFYLIVHNK